MRTAGVRSERSGTSSISTSVDPTGARSIRLPFGSMTAVTPLVDATATLRPEDRGTRTGDGQLLVQLLVQLCGAEEARVAGLYDRDLGARKNLVAQDVVVGDAETDRVRHVYSADAQRGRGRPGQHVAGHLVQAW